jgi:hypothetical protein
VILGLLLASGSQGGLVLCVGAEGHLSVEMGAGGRCCATTDTGSGESKLYAAESLCASCMDIPLPLGSGMDCLDPSVTRPVLAGALMAANQPPGTASGVTARPGSRLPELGLPEAQPLSIVGTTVLLI